MKHRKWTIALLGGLLVLSLVLTACGAEETPEAPAEEPVAVT